MKDIIFYFFIAFVFIVLIIFINRLCTITTSIERLSNYFSEGYGISFGEDMITIENPFSGIYTFETSDGNTYTFDGFNYKRVNKQTIKTINDIKKDSLIIIKKQRMKEMLCRGEK